MTITIRTRLNINNTPSYFDTSFEASEDDPREIFRGNYINPSDKWNFETVVESVNQQLANRGFECQLTIAENYPLNQPFPLEKLPVDAGKQQGAVISGLAPHALYNLTFNYGTEEYTTGDHTLIELVNAIWELRARTADDGAPQIRDGIKIGNHSLPIEIGIAFYKIGTDENWWADSRYLGTLDNVNNLVFEDGFEYSAEISIYVMNPSELHTLHPEDGIVHIDRLTPFNVMFKAVDPASIANAEIERHTLNGDPYVDTFTPQSTYSTDFDKNYWFLFTAPTENLSPKLTLLNITGSAGVVELIRSLPGEIPPMESGFPRAFSDLNVPNDVFYLNDLLPFSVRCDFDAGTVEHSGLIVDEVGVI